MRILDKYRQGHDRVRLGLGMAHKESEPVVGLRARGDVFFHMVDARSGEVLLDRHQKNIITLDASILVAMLCKDPDSRTHGINMLAVGTGATGALLSPDAPDNRQRKLNAEVQRKAFTSTAFRDGSGNAVAYPTSIVDFVCSYGEAEAVGPLNEMGLYSTVSANAGVQNLNPNSFPTRSTSVDVSAKDILFNYITFSVVSKPSTAVLTITWRISF